MTLEEPNPNSDHSLDCLVGDPASFLHPSLFDDLFSGYIDGYGSGDESLCFDYLLDSSADSLNPATTEEPISASIPDRRKRKLSDHQPPISANVEKVAAMSKKSSKISRTKAPGGDNGHNGKGRWAQQLLLPCAAAAAAGNLSRFQHLLFVVNELASATGDANHRLAYHGLRALNHHLSSSSAVPLTFASSDPGFLQESQLKFDLKSPWFAFPYTIANASILQILAGEQPDSPARTLHVLDIGVSHGMQWPTLLEALSSRSGGPPPLIRLTVVTAAYTDQHTEPPFSVGPPGDSFKLYLEKFAKKLKINLEINIISNNNENPLRSINTQIINSSQNHETLIISAQFRLHQLSHTSPDDKTEFLKSLTELNPKGVVLVDNDADCSCEACGDFGAGFAKSVENLWRFLDSTRSAFNFEESEGRRLMEGEAAKGLTSRGERNERKEKWGERMRGCGFVGVEFGGDAIDGARALLRKYDRNWTMKVEEKEREGCVSLLWKNQPVSFCSLWKVGPTK